VVQQLSSLHTLRRVGTLSAPSGRYERNHFQRMQMREYACELIRRISVRGRIRPAFTSALLIIFGSTALLFSQTIRQRSHDVKNGERIYKSGCIVCHGANGQGAPETLTEFKRPDTFPDFMRCDQTTPEPNSAWKDVIVNGGPSRGFSEIMPAFGKLLTSDQIDD